MYGFAYGFSIAETAAASGVSKRTLGKLFQLFRKRLIEELLRLDFLDWPPDDEVQYELESRAADHPGRRKRDEHIYRAEARVRLAAARMGPHWLLYVLLESADRKRFSQGNDVGRGS